MKNIYVLSLFLLCALPVFSQDLVVTSKGDSINCKITKMKSDFVYFTFNHQGEIRNTLLPVSQVVSCQFNFYQQSEVPKEKMMLPKDYKQFRCALNVGASSSTAKLSESIPSNLKEYMNDMKSGYHFGGDFTWFLSESLGFGAKYSIFHSSNSLDRAYF